MKTLRTIAADIAFAIGCFILAVWDTVVRGKSVEAQEEAL